MDKESIFWIAGAWLIGNAIFPLIFNSFERQYQRQIDSVVRGSINLSKKGATRLLQVALIFLLLPTLLIALAAERVLPRISISNKYVRDLRITKNATLERGFPTTYAKAFKAFKMRKKR